MDEIAHLMYNTDITMKYLGAIVNVLMIISYAQY